MGEVDSLQRCGRSSWRGLDGTKDVAS